MDLDKIHLYIPLIILFFFMNFLFDILGLDKHVFLSAIYAWAITAFPCCILLKMDKKNCNGLSFLDDGLIIFSLFSGFIALIYLYVSYYIIGISLQNSKNYFNIMMNLYVLVLGVPMVTTISAYYPLRFDINFNGYFIDKMIQIIEDITKSRINDYGIYFSNLSLNYLQYTFMSERDYNSLNAQIQALFGWYNFKNNINGNIGNNVNDMLIKDLFTSTFNFLGSRMYYSLIPVEPDTLTNAFIYKNPVCTYRYGMIVSFIRLSLFFTFLYGMFAKYFKNKSITTTIKSSKKKK